MQESVVDAGSLEFVHHLVHFAEGGEGHDLLEEEHGLKGIAVHVQRQGQLIADEAALFDLLVLQQVLPIGIGHTAVIGVFAVQEIIADFRAVLHPLFVVNRSHTRGVLAGRGDLDLGAIEEGSADPVQIHRIAAGNELEAGVGIAFLDDGQKTVAVLFDAEDRQHSALEARRIPVVFPGHVHVLIAVDAGLVHFGQIAMGRLIIGERARAVGIENVAVLGIGGRAHVGRQLQVDQAAVFNGFEQAEVIRTALNLLLHVLPLLGHAGRDAFGAFQPAINTQGAGAAAHEVLQLVLQEGFGPGLGIGDTYDRIQGIDQLLDFIQLGTGLFDIGTGTLDLQTLDFVQGFVGHVDERLDLLEINVHLVDRSLALDHTIGGDGKLEAAAVQHGFDAQFHVDFIQTIVETEALVDLLHLDDRLQVVDGSGDGGGIVVVELGVGDDQHGVQLILLHTLQAGAVIGVVRHCRIPDKTAAQVLDRHGAQFLVAVQLGLIVGVHELVIGRNLGSGGYSRGSRIRRGVGRGVGENRHREDTDR